MPLASERILEEAQAFFADKEMKCMVLEKMGANGQKYLQDTFSGRQGSLYEGGTYKIAINLPEAYPSEPPQMALETAVFHRNIDRETVCLVPTTQPSVVPYP